MNIWKSSLSLPSLPLSSSCVLRFDVRRGDGAGGDLVRKWRARAREKNEDASVVLPRPRKKS